MAVKIYRAANVLPSLGIEFSTLAQKNNFIAQVKEQAKKQGINFPLVTYDANSKKAYIEASTAANSLGCKITNGKFSVDFGNEVFKTFLIDMLGINNAHAVISPSQIQFHANVLQPYNQSVFLQPAAPQAPVMPQPSGIPAQQQNAVEVITKIYRSNNPKPVLGVEFASIEERNTFLTEAKAAGVKLGAVNFPFQTFGNDNKLYIGPSTPQSPLGCYIAQNGKFAIHFGSGQFQNFLKSRMGISNQHGALAQDGDAMEFNANLLQIPYATLPLESIAPVVQVPVNPQIAQVPEIPNIPVPPIPKVVNPPLILSNSAAEQISEVQINASLASNKPLLQLSFKDKSERDLFMNEVNNKANQLGINSINLPFMVQNPNKVTIKSSNFPAQPMGCYISANQEIAINLGNNAFRDFVLEKLSLNDQQGLAPVKGKQGDSAFYFDPQILAMQGPAIITKPNAVAPKAEEADNNYLHSDEALSAIEYVFNEFLSKPYNPELYDVFSADWDMNTPAGKVERPNHGIAHTLRVAALVPVIADFLKKHSPDPKFAQLTEKEIQKAQYMMLFSVIGRENDLGWTDANEYLKYQKAHGVQNPIHLYSKFKETAQAGFLKHVKQNPPKIFNKQELNFWAQALDTGKPGVNSPQGILMAIAHDLDLMRCYGEGQFSAKIDNLKNLLGSNKFAALDLLDYAHSLIEATGDRCMGYGDHLNYKKNIFGKVSLDYKECLKRIESVPKPVMKEGVKVQMNM